MAYLHTGQYDESERDLKTASKLDPAGINLLTIFAIIWFYVDASIKRQYAALQEQLKIFWKNEQKKYKGMFENNDTDT